MASRLPSADAPGAALGVDLQRLAEVEDPAGAAISIHLSLDPSEAPTPPELAARVNSLLDEAGKLRPADGPHEAIGRFDAAHERLRAALSDARELPGRRARALAVFAVADEFLEVVRLPDPARDAVAVGPRLAVAETAIQSSRPGEVLILVASREEGQLWRYRAGTLGELFDDFDEQERRHDQGGWAQMTLQRWADEAADAHLRRVAEHLERVHGMLGRPPLLISADEESRATIRRFLTQPADEAVAGEAANLRDVGREGLTERAEAALGELRDRTQRTLLDRHGEQAEAPAGLEPTLEALNDRRVEWLLTAGEEPELLLRCPSCGRLAAQAGWCPFDGSGYESQPHGLDEMARAAVAQAAGVWRLLDPPAQRDALPGGFAATVRF
jgi:release factor family 10